MQITEPTTMLTDYALAAVAGYLAVKQWKFGREADHKSVQVWSLAFFMLAAGAVLGGTSHGFALHLSEFSQAFFWKATVFSIGLTSLFLLCGALISAFRRPALNWFMAFAFGKFIIYAVWMSFHDDFIYVVIDYLPSMLVVVGLQIYTAISRQTPSSKWLISGILISFIAAGIQMSGFDLHSNFNHNDIYHTVQIVAMFVLHAGVMRMTDAGGATRI